MKIAIKTLIILLCTINVLAENISFHNNLPLEKCIRDNLINPYVQFITVEAALKITKINCDGYKNLTSIDQLTFFKNLEELSINKATKLDNITALSNLIKLNRLSITYSAVKDITPLSTLDNLTYLDMTHSSVTDITPISALKALETLILVWQGPNYITDLSPLNGLTNLRILDLSSNRISDITPLATLQSLEYLGLRDNRISDITPLVTLRSLLGLNISINMLTDIESLQNLNGIEALNASTNKIESLSFIANMNKISHLDLKQNRIVDIAPLGQNNSIKTLKLDINLIVDLEPLRLKIEGFSALKNISLAFNCIPNTDSFYVKNLEYVNFKDQCKTLPIYGDLSAEQIVNKDLIEAIYENIDLDNETIDNIKKDLQSNSASATAGCSIYNNGGIDIILYIAMGYFIVFYTGKRRTNKNKR